ncbi:MAG: hypothetical protein EOM23_01255 [Candidatus Moranbacteria bacterium]|nr:hypothetical protein [Candidatus Moranbacteria bacterium]
MKKLLMIAIVFLLSLSMSACEKKGEWRFCVERYDGKQVCQTSVGIHTFGKMICIESHDTDFDRYICFEKKFVTLEKVE